MGSIVVNTTLPIVRFASSFARSKLSRTVDAIASRRTAGRRSARTTHNRRACAAWQKRRYRGSVRRPHRRARHTVRNAADDHEASLGAQHRSSSTPRPSTVPIISRTVSPFSKPRASIARRDPTFRRAAQDFSRLRIACRCGFFRSRQSSRDLSNEHLMGRVGCGRRRKEETLRRRASQRS
jgi:hypothetical protein